MARYSFTDVADGDTLSAARIMELQTALERQAQIVTPVDAGFSWFNQGTISGASNVNGIKSAMQDFRRIILDLARNASFPDE